MGLSGFQLDAETKERSRRYVEGELSLKELLNLAINAQPLDKVKLGVRATAVLDRNVPFPCIAATAGRYWPKMTGSYRTFVAGYYVSSNSIVRPPRAELTKPAEACALA